MSMAIKVAKGQFQGDPGLFSFLGKAAKKIGGAAFGLAAKVGLPGAAFGQAILRGQPKQARVRPGVGAAPTFQVPRGVEAPPTFFPSGARGVSAAPFLPLAAGAAVAATNGVGTTIACPSGFHPNKSDYFLKTGEFVGEGTRCVRNRRRNPFNPRATDRAIGRIEGAKRAAKRLGRITIRKACD